MAHTRRLQNAPIIEALIDLRLAEELKEAAGVVFAQLRDPLRDRFPDAKEKKQLQAKLEVKHGQLTAEAEELGVTGLFFTSGDGTTVAQFRTDGFTYNRLRPYPTWDELLPEALDLWARYVAAAQPRRVARIALRYINRLEIPLTKGPDFSAYLAAGAATGS